VDVPIRLRDSAMPESSAAPRLGEHTASILAQLGLGARDLEQLQADGVV